VLHEAGESTSSHQPDAIRGRADTGNGGARFAWRTCTRADPVPMPPGPVTSAAAQVQLGHTRGYRPSIPLPNYDVKLLKVRVYGRAAA
jgi:hypothetical protein